MAKRADSFCSLFFARFRRPFFGSFFGRTKKEQKRYQDKKSDWGMGQRPSMNIRVLASLDEQRKNKKDIKTKKVTRARGNAPQGYFRILGSGQRPIIE
jgi:hypothetical protein